MTPQTDTQTGRLAAVWFADIVGYSKLSAEDEPAALRIVDLFQDVAREEIERQNGRLVKFIGDAALAEFKSTAAAVRAANALNREFAERSADNGRPAELRIGVHVGEVAAGSDGDIYGDGVNTASRLQAAADAGRVIVSEDVWRHLRSRPEFQFSPLGQRRLRGLAAPIGVFATRPADSAPATVAPLWRNPKRLFSELRDRRVLRILASYTALGWLLLQVVDQLVGRAMLPEFSYQLTLVWYLAGLPAAAIMGWFHGDKGRQSTSIIEVAMLGTIGVFLLAFSGSAITDHMNSQAAISAAAESALDLRRVGVLYFDDLSRGGERQYLADGLTESLIDELEGVRALDVVSSNGVAQFRGTDIPRDSIAQVLRTGSLVAGSIEEVGDRMHVNVRLLDGASGAEFQRAGFELPSGDLFEIRSRVVDQVSRLLREWLGEEIELREERAGTANPAAWALLQRAEKARKDGTAALHHHDQAAMAAAFRRADSLLDRAELLDPEWVEPVVLQGRLDYERSRLLQGEPRRAVEWIRRGMRHANDALELASNHPEALELRGTLNYWHWLLNVTPNPEAHDRLLSSARTDLEEAVRLDPTLASAYSTLSALYYGVDLTSAVLAARRAYEEDAYLNVADGVLWRLALGSYDLGQFTQAQRWCAEGLRRFPADHRFSSCQVSVMTTPQVEAAPDTGWKYVAAVDSLVPAAMRPYWQTRTRLMMGGVLARAGLADSAQAVLDRAHDRINHEIDPTQELYYVEAAMRTIAGDYSTAVELLRRYSAAHPGATYDHHWWWRDLRGQPGFPPTTAHASGNH